MSTTILPARRKYLLGALAIVLAAVGFSTKAIFVKLAYRHGITSVPLLALRMLFSLPVFLVVNWWNNRHDKRVISRSDYGKILVLGLVGYYLSSLLDFMGLQYVSASIERLILFVYPTMVVVLSAIFLKKPLERVHLLALGITYLGIALALGQEAQVAGNNSFWWGCTLIFTCALTYAIYLMGSGELIPRIGSGRYTSLIMLIAGVAILLQSAVQTRLDLWHFSPPVYFYAACMALVATVLPGYLTSWGIGQIGAGNASIISSLGPVSTIFLAFIFLDEHLNGWQWLGAVFVIIGVLIITLRKK